MTSKIDLELEGRIRQLFDDNMSQRQIRRHLLKLNYKVSHGTINNVINRRGKAREARDQGIIFKKRTHQRKLTESKLKKLERMTSVSDPLTQATMVTKLGVVQSTICKAITSKLDKKKRVKMMVHRLTENDKTNRKRNAKKLYNKLSLKQLEFTVTLDEAMIYLKQSKHKTKNYYSKRGQPIPDDCIIPCKESYPKRSMIVGGITGRGPLPLLKIPKNVKIDAFNYVKYVLKPIFNTHLPKLYPQEMSKILFHHDKASSHTSIFTTSYLDVQRSKYGLTFLDKQDIPVRGADISPMDFFGFGFLKQKLEKTNS